MPIVAIIIRKGYLYIGTVSPLQNHEKNAIFNEREGSSCDGD